MEETKSMYMKCMRVIFAILLVNTCICTSVWGAINQDTPNLSFENGAASFPTTFSDDDLGVWKRYYGFYGAEHFDVTQVVNKISTHHNGEARAIGGRGDEDNDGWVRYGVELSYTLPNRTNSTTYPNTGKYTIANGLQGKFDIITDRTLDPCVYNTADCRTKVPFYTMPNKLEDGQKVVRIGSTGNTETRYSSYEPRGYYRRAHAERMVYSFEVKENSTLLTVQFAAFLEDPDDPSQPAQAGAHIADERPTTSVSVTLKKNGTNQIVKPVCSEYEASLNNSQLDLGIVGKECNNYARNSSPARYKDWTTNVYDLRENRNLLIKGQADFMPKDGEQLRLMLAQLQRQDEALTSLFAGTVSRDTTERTFFVCPAKPADTQVLFRFSRLRGLVDADDLSGEPFYITVQDLKTVPTLVVDAAAAKKKQKPNEKGIYVNVPSKMRVTILQGNDIVGEAEHPAPQFGHVELLSDQLFNKRYTTRLTLNPVSGEVDRLEAELPKK